MQRAEAAAVYDGIGKTTFAAGFDALAPTGRMILYGSASGRPDPLTRIRSSRGLALPAASDVATYTRTPELLRGARGRGLRAGRAAT